MTNQEQQAERRVPASQPILLRALRWGMVASVVLIVAFAGIGWLVDDRPGLIGGVLGAAFAGIFLALTAGSIAFANRFVQSDLFVAVFFGIVLGSWILKFIAFIVAAVLLKDQPWLNPTVLFLGVISGVILSLVIDVLVVTRSRIPTVELPD